MNTLEQSQKHLLTEQVNKASTSFIANINAVASFVNNSTYITALKNVSTISANVATVSNKVNTLQGTVNTHTNSISTLQNSLSTTNNNISGINSTLSTLNSTDAALDKRITALETAVPSMPDMSQYYNKEETAQMLAKKRDVDDSYSDDVIEQKLTAKLDAKTNVERAGSVLQVGDDGKIIYNPKFALKWGNFEGNIEDQKDLVDALALKANLTDIHDPVINIKRKGETLFTFSLNQEQGGDVDVGNVIDYHVDINNKPKINGVVIDNDLSSKDLKLDAGIILAGGTDVIFVDTTLPAEAHWVGAAYNATGKVLIIIGYSDNNLPLVYKSTDNGKTWTGISSIGEVPYAIVYGNNTFVITTNSNHVFTSVDDGETFTSYDIGVSKLWSNLAFGNGYFVAIAALVTDDSYGVARSIDGKTWTLTKALTNIQIADIIYGGGKFAVIGTSVDSNYLGYSDNYGITWQRIDLPDNKNYTKLGYLNGSWLILNGSSSDNTAYIANNDFSKIETVTIFDDTHDGMHSIISTGTDIKVFPGKTNSVISTTDLTTWDKGKLPVSAEWYTTAVRDNLYCVLSGYTTQSNAGLSGSADMVLMYNGKDVTNDVKKVLGIA